MSSRRYKGSAVTEEDIHIALKAIWEDCGCKARVWISIASDPYHVRLLVNAEAYTETEGVRVGVSRREEVWSQSHSRSLFGVVLLALHHVYQDAWTKAHAK